MLLLGCGVPLYLLARARYGAAVAVCSYLFLFCNPMLPRVLLWDLTPFVSVPCALAGITIWLRAGEGRRFNRLASGFLFSLSVNSHAFTATAIGYFLAVETGFVLLQRDRWAKLSVDVICTALGAAAAVAVGVAYYNLRVGHFGLIFLMRSTVIGVIIAMKDGIEHALPVKEWAATATYAYVPPLLAIAAVVLLGRRLFANTVEARIAWFAIAYISFYAFCRFVAGLDVIEHFIISATLPSLCICLSLSS